MEKVSKRRLKLYFKDADNSQRTISIDNPAETYTDEAIKGAMDTIIATGVLETKKGKVTTKANAEMETIEKVPYNLKKA